MELLWSLYGHSWYFSGQGNTAPIEDRTTASEFTAREGHVYVPVSPARVEIGRVRGRAIESLAHPQALILASYLTGVRLGLETTKGLFEN